MVRALARRWTRKRWECMATPTTAELLTTVVTINPHEPRPGMASTSTSPAASAAAVAATSVAGATAAATAAAAAAAKDPKETHTASVGQELAFCFNLGASLAQGEAAGLDFLVVPLVHPRQRRHRGFETETWRGQNLALSRADVLLASRKWGSVVVGRVSQWAGQVLNQGANEVSAEPVKHAAAALGAEMSYAMHLGLPVVLLPEAGPQCHVYARPVNALLQAPHPPQVWVEASMWHEPRREASSSEDDDNGEEEEEEENNGEYLEDGGWQQWHTFHELCGCHANVHVALRVPAVLPERSSVLDRWLAEPVKAAILHTSLFVPNRKGFPVLPAAHQYLVGQLVKRKIQLILRGRPRHEDGARVYQMYLGHLASRVAPPTEAEQFEAPYYDYLQSPLQPLFDNLESQTYETFELDPVKYARYEDAIERALRAVGPDQLEVVIMVVGAGRGPLVSCAIRAAEKAGRANSVKLYALEKNPNAIMTLRFMQRTTWDGQNVTVVQEDMRRWAAPEQADILVSELLGSFGDNELSPECLDGAQRLLKAHTGVSIPQSYTSFVAPLMSSKLWNTARAYASQFGGGFGSKLVEVLETPYVTKIFNACVLDEPQPCFHFSHPVPEAQLALDGGTNESNERCTAMEFEMRESGVVHGFAGYFESRLWGDDVMISILPSTFSTGMFSWFEMYFPLREPITVQRGETVRVCFWRCTGKERGVWYEWAIVGGVAGGGIHNVGGRSSHVKM